VDSHKDKVFFCAVFLFPYFREWGKMSCLVNFGYSRFYVPIGGKVTVISGGADSKLCIASGIEIV